MPAPGKQGGQDFYGDTLDVANANVANQLTVTGPHINQGPLVAQSLTVTTGPYTSVLPGAPSVATPAGIVAGKQWDFGGQVWNVMNFNAKGDGSTNDTTAFQAAHDALPSVGGVIYVPPAAVDYRFTSQINQTKQVTWMGAGSYMSLIKRINSAASHIFHLTGTGTSGSRFLDLGIDCNGVTNNVTATCAGIYTDAQCDNLVVQRVRLFNADGFALFNFAGPTSRVDNLRLVDCEIVHVAGATHDLCTVISNGGIVRGCRFQVTGGNYGMNLYESLDVVVQGNTFQSPGGGGNKQMAVSSCTGSTVTGNSFVGGDADIAIEVLCEQDNANNLNAIDTVITGNEARGVATGNSKFVQLSGGTHANKSVLNTLITGNQVDTWQWFLFHNSGTIDRVVASNNQLIGVLNNFGNNVTPTNVFYDNNSGWNPRGQQSAAFAASLTPSLGNGHIFGPVQLTGNVTAVNAPTPTPGPGQRMTLIFQQDGTGGRTVAGWNAIYKQSWADTGNTLNKRSAISFQFDGTNWQQDGAQTPYV